MLYRLSYFRVAFAALPRNVVGADGFEPPKSKTADLQSAPFGHSGTHPRVRQSRTRIDERVVNKVLDASALRFRKPRFLIGYGLNFVSFIKEHFEPLVGLEPTTAGLQI